MTAFTSVKSGDWSDPTVWGNGLGGDYPCKTTSDDTVLIGSGHTVTYDIDNSVSGLNHRMGKITCGSGETLAFATTKSTYLHIRGDSTSAINCSSSGTIKIGTDANNPLSSSYTCTIEIDQATDSTGRIIDLTNDGEALIFGMVKTVQGNTTSAITADSSNTFTMSTVPSDWAIGDELLIQGTNATSSNENDEITITNISGTTVTFTGNGVGSKAEFSHVSGTMVLNFTRNIKFISTSTLSRGIYGVYASNGKADMRYVDFNGCTNKDHGGAWALSTQDGANRYIYIEGCVTRNQGLDGAYMNGSGHKKYHKCIIYNNGQQGLDGTNDSGVVEITESYFVANSSYGLLEGNRGDCFISDSFFWTNINGVRTSNKPHYYNCYFFNNSDAEVYIGSGQGFFSHCFFGESPVATQNSGYASIKCGYGGARCNDCTFNNGTEIAKQNASGEVSWSSNHNQVSGALLMEYSKTGEEISTDLSTYRTTSPSIKMLPAVWGNFVVYRIPVKVTSGSAITISIYGKKSNTTLWFNPKARLIGCGLDDNAEWTVSDLLWNEITLTGTPTRDGIAEVIVTAYSEQFNIDDIMVS